MEMIKLNGIQDFNISLPKIEKSVSDDGHSLLNTTQDSSLSEDSSQK